MAFLQRLLYTLILYLATPFVFVRLFVRGLSNRGYWHRVGERFGLVPRLAGAPLWIHAVSVGEVRAAAPLVRALLREQPQRPILVTTMTPTGSAQVLSLFGATVHHCYLPYDLPGAVARFLGRTRPRALAVMETELWPNLYRACARRGIPIAVVNLRLSQRSARGYGRVAALTRATLECVSAFGVHAQADATRLTALGAPAARVQVLGSIKFDVEVAPDLMARGAALRAQWGAARPVWIGASTHEGEEDQLLAAHASLRAQFPDLLLVLVPRHPERFGAVAELLRANGLRYVRRSSGEAAGPDTEVYLGDTMGELMLLFAASNLAFVGGSLVPRGGHNLLEASALGLPVLFGPHTFNFAEIARLTREREAGLEVEDGAALVSAARRYLADPALRLTHGTNGRRFVATNRGALARTLELLRRVAVS